MTLDTVKRSRLLEDGTAPDSAMAHVYCGEITG